MGIREQGGGLGIGHPGSLNTAGPDELSGESASSSRPCLRVCGLGFEAWGLGCSVEGLGFWGKGLGRSVEGVGCRVEGGENMV